MYNYDLSVEMGRFNFTNKMGGKNNVNTDCKTFQRKVKLSILENENMYGMSLSSVH